MNYGSFGNFSRIRIISIWFTETTDNVTMNFFTSFHSFASNDIFEISGFMSLVKIVFLSRVRDRRGSPKIAISPQIFFVVERLGRYDSSPKRLKYFSILVCIF